MGFLETVTAEKLDIPETGPLDAALLKKLCLGLGADDTGLVEIGREGLAAERESILAMFPRTKTLVCLAARINRDTVRSPFRSVANTEFNFAIDRLCHVYRNLTAALERNGVRSVGFSGAFPMETDAWPGKMWPLSQKTIAVEAGLGKMGTHRLVIHPSFGSFVYFATVLIDREVTRYDGPITENPCDGCNLCVAVCPTGAISKDRRFNFVGCFAHDYREKLGGFSDWVENVVRSRSVSGYRRLVTDRETVSLWQSLAYKPSTKCDYCMAACPAGSEVHPDYDADKAAFMREVIKPLQQKRETIYVVPGSDAEEFAQRRFPHKTVKRIGMGARPASIDSFIFSMPRIFQPERAAGLDAVYHLSFTGSEETRATVTIRGKTIDVQDGLIGTADLSVTADSDTWLKFLAKEKSVVLALVTRKIKVSGPMRLFPAFGRCFPL